MCIRDSDKALAANNEAVDFAINVEVPDENTTLINALNASGVFVKLDFNKNTTKKNKKGE